MTTFPGSPKTLRSGIVLVDPASAKVLRVITLQYNPDSISRTLQVQGIGEQGARSEALRLKGPAVETFKLEAELDATDQLEFPKDNPNAVQLGLHPQIAVLEALVNPSVADIMAQNMLAQLGTIEIAPAEMPLALFVWSAQRVLPVRVTELSITEEAFDPALNPIRAKVSLGLRVLSVEDLPLGHKGTALFLGYLQGRERLSALVPSGGLDQLGIGGTL
jgi:Contractile injection system tube protein